MTNNLQHGDLQNGNMTGKSVLGEGAEKYIRDSANIEDLPGDDEDLPIDDEEEEDDDVEIVESDGDVDDVETETAINGVEDEDDEEDEDYINKDEAKKDLKERGLDS